MGASVPWAWGGAPADHACRSVTPADLDLACWLQGQGPSKGCGDHEWKIPALPKSDKYVKSPAGIGRGRGDCPAPHTGKNKGRPSGERALPAPHCSPSRGRKRPGAVFQRRTPARRAPPLRRSRTPAAEHPRGSRRPGREAWAQTRCRGRWSWRWAALPAVHLVFRCLTSSGCRPPFTNGLEGAARGGAPRCAPVSGPTEGPVWAPGPAL